MSPQGDSLVHSSRVTNLGRSNPFWYFMMSPGDSCSLLYSLVGLDGSGELPWLGAKVGSSVDFSLGCTGSRVGSEDGGLLGKSPWPFYLLSESSRCIRECMTLSSLLESLYYVSMDTIPGGWRVHISLCCGVATAAQAYILSGSLKNSANMLWNLVSTSWTLLMEFSGIANTGACRIVLWYLPWS